MGDSKQGRLSVGAPVPVWEPHKRWAMCCHHLPALLGTCPEDGGGASVVSRLQWWAAGPHPCPLAGTRGRDNAAPRSAVALHLSPEPRALSPPAAHNTPPHSWGQFWMPPAHHQAAGCLSHLQPCISTAELHHPWGQTRGPWDPGVPGSSGPGRRWDDTQLVPETKAAMLRGPKRAAQLGPSSARAPATSPGRLGATSCPSAYLELGAPKLSVPWITPA